MILNHSFTVRCLALVATLSVGLSYMSPAFAITNHSFLIDINSKEVIDLGSLGGGDTVANAINDVGQAAGVSYNPTADAYRAFITGPNGVGMTDLGTFLVAAESYRLNSAAYGINDAGQVAGWSDSVPEYRGYRSPFITGPNGMGMTQIAGGSGTGVVGVYGINDAGQVVGWEATPDGLRHAFITGRNGVGTTDLGTLVGSESESSAQAINDAGQVVGWSDASGGVEHAFITGLNGAGMTDLGTLGGRESSAQGINDGGQVVGISQTTAGNNHTFITGPNGMGMRDLGTLGGTYSEAFGINETGQVVGYSFTAGGASHAFITGPNGMGMRDLNSLIVLPEGMILTSATAINNNGQVLAIAIVPEPKTYVLMLVGLGSVWFMARRRADLKFSTS